MQLRRARPDDAACIGDYHHRCWLEGYAALVDQDALDRLRVEDRIARWERALRQHGGQAETSS